MIKSIWLSNLIVSSLNDESSVLSTYYRHLSRLANSQTCKVALFEPNQTECTCFLISGKSACVVSAESVGVKYELLKKIAETEKLEQKDGKLFCPLKIENTAPFGVMIIETDTAVSLDKINEAVLAFSVVLYSESMGSIVDSFHKTAMSVKDVCVDYTHGKMINRVVNKVSLNIYEQEFTVIMGASGSGKTSLINVLGGMLTASEGEVLWGDIPITGMGEAEKTAYRRNSVGFIFQRYNLIDDLTAEENIEIAASLVKDPLPTETVLKMVGLSDKAKFYPSELSGGEQQRVCIARALVKKAKLLFCDEPTGALDTENAKQVILILKNIAKEQKIPVVVITHNPKLVVIADHCITISNGTIEKDILQPFALSGENIEL